MPQFLQRLIQIPVCVLLNLLLLSSAIGQEACALNSQFVINTYTTNAQEKPSVDMLPDGRYVVAWSSNGQDGDLWGVYARSYDANNMPGSEIPVNMTTSASQNDAKVAVMPNGNFVVTWEGFDVSQRGVFARVFLANGTPLTDEFQINTFTNEAQRGPDIAMDINGNFVIVWESFTQEPGAGFNTGVYGQRFTAAGVKVGPEFLINVTTTGSQHNAAVTMSPGGSFVVVWQTPAQDGDGEGIYARRYDAAGNPLSGEFRVNGFFTGTQALPDIDMDDAGNFIITWVSENQDGDDFGIFAKLYAANGSVAISEFQVNTITAGVQSAPHVDMDADGDFVITFYSFDGIISEDIFARRYNNAGIAQGIEFLVNSYTTSYQGNPAVSMSEVGKFIIVWDGSLDGIETSGVGAQLFGVPNLSAVLTQNGPCATPVPGAIDLTVTPAGAYSYAWSNGAATEDLNNLAAGTYTVTVSQDGGCSATATYTIACQSEPIPTMGQWGLMCLFIILCLPGISLLKYPGINQAPGVKK